jgi:hypothetical protein
VLVLGLLYKLIPVDKKSCSFRPKNGLQTPAELRWCEPDPAGEANGCNDRQYNTLNFEPLQSEVCDPANGDKYDPSKCFCTGIDVNDRSPSMYGGWWTVNPGIDKTTNAPRKSRQGRYFDTWTNPFLWQWMPRTGDWPQSHIGDMVPVDALDKDPVPWRKHWWPKRQVTINYALPVLDKITPDTLRGHDELSEVKLAQLPKEQRDAMVNQTSGTSFEIGDSGELITMTGTGFGVIRNVPYVTIDDMRCENALLEKSDKYPDGHPLPALTLRCDAPITIVGPKGYDERINAMRMEIKVGDQAAIINPDLDAPTKKNLLRTLCRRGKYGQEFEKCAGCPSPAKGAKAAGSECMGGMGVEAEPKPAPFWFSLPLIKDDLTWKANETRFSRRPDLRFTWTTDDKEIGIDQQPENYVGDALSRAAVFELQSYTSFCNQTVKPNGTVCEIETSGPRMGQVSEDDKQNAADGLCIMPGQYPPDAFWIGQDYKTCYHYYDEENPGYTAWGVKSNKKGYDVKCEGKGALCCLSRWCTPSAATDGINNQPAIQGWSFVRKTRSKQIVNNAGLEKETDVGCAIPMTFGDPRFYVGREDAEGDCMSATHGWYVWEEDRVANGRLPKRIKEQELAECGPAETPFCNPPVVVGSSHENGCIPRGATKGSLCTKAVNLRVAGGGGVEGGGKPPGAKPAAATPAAATESSASKGLRRFLEEVTGAAPSAAAGGGGGDNVDTSAAGGLTGADNRCHIDRWNRPVCPYFVPCDPSIACIGDNMCGVGYVGKKCNKCDYGYFRSDGYCIGCPENGYLMLGMFLFGIVVVGLCLAIISWLKINIGVISIGIDYFQIIGLFASPKIPWPKQMVTVFDYMSASSANIDLAAPECMGQGGGMAAHEKWFLTMFLPLGVLMLLVGGVGLDLLITILKDTKKKAKAIARGTQNKNGSGKDIKVEIEKRIGTVVSVFLTIFYLVYVNLTKKATDIFNCAAADPPDDPVAPTLYMSIDPSQECWRPGTWETGMHVKLIPWALACCLCYSLAFPLFLYFKFTKNKQVIFEDQLLNAQDRGEVAKTNPNFSFRKRYSTMYKNYKPDHWYWAIVLMVKKLAICFTGLMFRRNPMFQLSVAILVLFTCFVLQVLHRPFMSMEEKAAVVKMASKRDFERGHKMLRKMAAFGNADEIERAKKRLAMEEAAQLTVAKSIIHSSKFFINYNQVETVFLGCAIYVCLSGIMFSSGYFDNVYYKAQGDAIGIVTLLVVVGSILYYAWVIGKEINGVAVYRRERNKAKWSSFKQKASFHKNVMSLDNAKATEGEKKAANKIGAAFVGKKARSDMHDDIMKNGTEEQKDKLGRLETTRRDKRTLAKKKRSRSLRKRKTRDPNETPEMRAARKKRQLKKRQTRKLKKDLRLKKLASEKKE